MGKHRILVVEDEAIVSMEIKYMIESMGYEVAGSASNGDDAVKLAGKLGPDLILMDILLQGDRDGIDTAEEIRKDYSIPIIYVTAFADDSTLQRAKITSPYGYVIKPIQYKELNTAIEIALYKHRADMQLQQHIEKLHKTIEGIINAMAKTVEIRDPYTAGHQRRVARLAKLISERLGLSEAEIDGVYMASMIHDIGKLSIPSEILSKPGKLSETEFNILKIHPESGHEILKNIEFPWPIAEMVLQHHERLNGSGYPQGLTGDKMLAGARVMVVSDVVEAMASHRPYRAALGVGRALEEITQNRGILYDPIVVDACINLVNHPGFDLNTELDK
ncbi:MAG: response regulator [Spirochaetes bacterium]|nr:MAG: response regulator [Spirochaetota bacterium]